LGLSASKTRKNFFRALPPFLRSIKKEPARESPERVAPSACKHLRSLSDAFYEVPDHRSPFSRRFSKIATFALISQGLLVGSPNVKAIWKRCTALSQGQREAFGLNVRNENGRLVMPTLCRHEDGRPVAMEFVKIVRGHWSVENLNHWKRDATDWREDRAPKRNPRGAKYLALLRSALLAVIPFEEFDSLNDAFDHYRDHRAQSLKIIRTASPCQD